VFEKEDYEVYLHITIAATARQCAVRIKCPSGAAALRRHGHGDALHRPRLVIVDHTPL